MIFGNIKEVDQYYKYPMSYRMGSIYDDNGIIRIYSNGQKGDYETDKYFYYKLKNKQDEESSDNIRTRVQNARNMQIERFKSIPVSSKSSTVMIPSSLLVLESQSLTSIASYEPSAIIPFN